MSRQKFESNGGKKATGYKKGKQKSSFFNEMIERGKEAYEKEEQAKQQADNSSLRKSQ